MKLKQRQCMTDQDLEARNLIQPGLELYGFLQGLFGRDSYDVKTVTEVRANVIVATNSKGHRIVSRNIDGEIYNWAGIVQSSNLALENSDYEGAPQLDEPLL